MKNLNRCLYLLALLLTLNACQKELSPTNPAETEACLKKTGAVADNPTVLAKVPLIISSDVYKSSSGNGSTMRRTKDGDGDGIPDANDSCPDAKETINGYLDTDGCPDTLPNTVVDSDNDGIPDAQDSCPNQAETINGYQDADGCPDAVPIIPDSTIVLPASSTLPSSISLAMPPVGNQGVEFSCVAWAVAQTRSAEQYFTSGSSTYNQSANIFSPEYIYNQVKLFSDCSSGTTITRCLALLQSQGVCTWQTLPYSSQNGCSLLPNETQIAEASKYKISSYVQILTSDQVAIKTMLSQKHPLVTWSSIDDNFLNAKAGFIWKYFSGTYGTTHAYIICGYDDAKHAYLVMNAWGTTWGDAGYSWIDYDFFGNISSGLFSMQL
jgi:hypothetical protein